MKTFKDLEFKKHPMFGVGTLQTHARMSFKNDYGISVITGGYGSASKPYEIAVLYKGEITYNTHITDDVIGYLTSDEVTEIMFKIQELKK